MTPNNESNAAGWAVATVVLVAIIVGSLLLFRGIAIPNLSGTDAETQRSGTSSTTVYSIGHQLSTSILADTGRRTYASFCNASPNRAYLNLSSSSITSTTTADILIAPGACHEFDGDNLYTGPVNAIQETATTTNSLLVTEFISS